MIIFYKICFVIRLLFLWVVIASINNSSHPTFGRADGEGTNNNNKKVLLLVVVVLLLSLLLYQDHYSEVAVDSYYEKKTILNLCKIPLKTGNRP